MNNPVSRVITVTTVIDGSDGYSSAIVRLYRRSASVLTDSDRPSGTLYYKFATGKLYTDAACTTEATGSSAAMNGWSMTKPQEDADTKLYVTMATATSRDEVDAIVVDSTASPAVNEWSTPVENTEGLHTATVMLYKRSATALSAHGITDSVYYRFADGKFFTTKAATTETAIETNKLNGWTRTVPETDGNPLYQIQATAVGIDALDNIGSGEWSTPIKMVEDGQPGAPGTMYQRIYKSTNSATEATPTGTNFPPTGWSTTPTAVSADARYRHMSERYSNDGGTTWTNWPTPVIDYYLAEDGRSIRINGQFTKAQVTAYTGAAEPTSADIINYLNHTYPNASQDDGYLYTENGHLWIFNGTTWEDIGQIQGPAGKDAQYIYLKGTARDVNNNVTSIISPVVKINDGNNLATQQRGLNLVLIDRQTLTIDTQTNPLCGAFNYDTYGEASGEAGKTGITDLIAKLNALDDSVFVCLVSFDAIGWSDALIAKLQTFGMDDLPYTATGRYPFLFIGYKNLGKGNGLTRMRNVGPYTDVVELSAYVANGALTMKDGENGIGIEISPANVILEQDSSNGTFSIDAQNPYPISIVAKAGDGTTNLVSSITNANSHCIASQGTSIVALNVDNTNKQIKVIGVNSTAVTNGYVEGIITATVNITGYDSVDIKIPVYLNLKQKFRREINGDTEEALVYANVYERHEDPDHPGEYIVNKKYLFNETIGPQGKVTTLEATVGDANSGLVKNVNTLTQTAQGLTSSVTALEAKRIDLADPDAWEQGSTTGETPGKTYEQVWTDSLTRIRTANIIPVTKDAYLVYNPTSTNCVQLLFFGTDKKLLSNAGTEWIQLNAASMKDGKFHITDGTVKYIAIVMRKADNSNIGVGDISDCGLSVINSPITTSSELLQTAANIKLEVKGEIPSINLISLLSWTDGTNPLTNGDVKLGKLGTAHDIISPQIYLEIGTYTFSVYCDSGIFILRVYNPNTGVEDVTTDGLTSTSETYQGKTRYKYTFTLSASKYVRVGVGYPAVSGSVTAYRPQLENGDTMTFYVPSADVVGSTGYVDVKANEVNIGIRQGLTNTGINISAGTVAVQANNFTVSDGNNQIFGVDGTTQRVTMKDVEIKGTLMYKRVYIKDVETDHNISQAIICWDDVRHQLAYDVVILYGTYNASKSFNIYLPPASTCVGAMVEIKNFTTNWSTMEQTPSNVLISVQQNIDDGPTYVTYGGQGGTVYCTNRFVVPFLYENTPKTDVTLPMTQHTSIMLIATVCPKWGELQEEDTYVWLLIDCSGTHGVTVANLDVSNNQHLTFQDGVLIDYMV